MTKKIAEWWNEEGDVVLLLLAVIQFMMFVPISNRLLSVPYGWICNLGRMGDIHALIALILEFVLGMGYALVWFCLDFILTGTVIEVMIAFIKKLFKIN